MKWNAMKTVSVCCGFLFLLVSCQHSDLAEVHITFPAYEYNKTEYNENLFKIPKFDLNITLPKTWLIQMPQPKEASGGFSPVCIMEGDQEVGSIDYNVFTIPDYADETSPGFYHGIYNQLMLGSMTNWDTDYTVIKRDEDSCSATCKIAVRSGSPDIPAAEQPLEYYPGILAYNKKLLVYIDISFEQDVVSDANLKKIAKSISITPTEIQE